MKGKGFELSLKWKLRIREAKSSNYTIREYCQQNGLTENQYYYWQNKLRHKCNNHLVPLIPARFSELTFLSEESRTPGLSIYFGDRIKVVPEKDFSEAEFIRIARLLKGVCQC
jgi:hypothetical protein